MSQPKPSEKALAIARHRRWCTALYKRQDGMPRACICTRRDDALAIDALVRAEVERERERCARIADTFASVAKAEARFDAAEDARFIAEQIRSAPNEPPPLPSGDEKERQ